MKWEYHVVHLNVDYSLSEIEGSSNPEVASEKLKGSLSADFLKDQFPEQFQDDEDSEHPAIQISKFLNKKGLESWELTETIKLGKMLFLIFKREVNY
ncbi:hypothetical protein [Prochlorococcus marinus]|uniref:hypothetical protein n=1 Tax=Prochlorococcus marinus TaxID=1219 RepID=UPI0022B4BE52|nr:hypothetical protein [Prochlorococcus marinus]